MNTMRGRMAICLAGLGLGLAALSGCQANVAGMTLPSGHYLEHPPQYSAPSPPYPLPRELASMDAINAANVPGGGPAVPLPAPVPAPVLPPPVPVPPVP